MNVSVNWLRRLAPEIADEAVPELARRLTMGAVAVDEVIEVGRGLGDLRVARVTGARPHPDADRLTLCRVDTGDAELDVVCGAPEVLEGALYPFVPPGGALPDGMTIERREIRGVTSHGMLCSERELGLGPEHEGILRLRGDLAPGTPLEEALDLPDARLVLDLTPNRVDLACHAGVARELAPSGDAGLVFRDFGGPAWEPGWATGDAAAKAAGVPVRIDDAGRCPRYLGAVVRGVEVGPSPAWLAGRLRAAGARPVNNVVDATNYVLLELNQPLHAFDLERLRGPEIGVRAAEAGEELRTLDGRRHELDPAQTVIVDAGGPVALAGVMGGAESEVGDATRDVFLECALFDPLHTRHTARAAGLATDASYRFERGVDPRGLEGALRRCVELILAVAGGEAEPVAARAGGPPPPRRSVTLHPDRVRQVLGRAFTPGELTAELVPLGFSVEGDGENGGEGDGSRALHLSVPGWRVDVTREIDLVEEIARRVGYDSFETEVRAFRPSAVPRDPAWDRADRVRRELVARGLLEARSLPLVAEDAVGDGRGVRVRNPLSEEESHLRNALIPVLLRRLEHNWARGERSVRLFEIGSVFAAAREPEGLPEEELRVAAVLTGLRRPEHWTGEGDVVDVWELMGLLEEVAESWCGGEVVPATPGSGADDPAPGETSDPAPGQGDAPAAGRSDAPGTGGGLPLGEEAWIGAERFRILAGDGPVGIGGRVRPEAVDAPDWADPVWAFELRLHAVRAHASIRYRPLSPYPPVARDLAFTVVRSRPVAEIEATLREAAPETLESLRLFDVYEGEGIEEGRRSLAWRFTFRARDRTLRDEEVERAMGAIVQRLEERHDARVRSS